MKILPISTSFTTAFCLLLFLNQFLEISFHFYLICFLGIEDEYKGPSLLNDKEVTLEFMKELMDSYKNLGKLHRKYAYKVRTTSYLKI